MQYTSYIISSYNAYINIINITYHVYRIRLSKYMTYTVRCTVGPRMGKTVPYITCTM